MAEKSLKNFAREMMQIVPSLMRGILKSQTDEIARGHITMPQYLVLDLIEKNGPSKMSLLAKEMDVSLPAMTGIVNRVYVLKMVDRRYVAGDRRIVNVALTLKGHNVVKKISRHRQNTIRKVFGKLNENERQTYLGIIKKVQRILHGDKKANE